VLARESKKLKLEHETGRAWGGKGKKGASRHLAITTGGPDRKRSVSLEKMVVAQDAKNVRGWRVAKEKKWRNTNEEERGPVDGGKWQSKRSAAEEGRRWSLGHTGKGDSPLLLKGWGFQHGGKN